MEGVIKGMKLFEQDPGLGARINIMYFEWQRAYPNVDVKSQISYAHVWLLSNQKKGKKDVIRFLNNWMKSEDRRTGERRQDDRRVRESRKYVEQKPDEEEVMTAEDFKKMRESIQR